MKITNVIAMHINETLKVNSPPQNHRNFGKDFEDNFF